MTSKQSEHVTRNRCPFNSCNLFVLLVLPRPFRLPEIELPVPFVPLPFTIGDLSLHCFAKAVKPIAGKKFVQAPTRKYAISSKIHFDRLEGRKMCGFARHNTTHAVERRITG